MICELFPFAVFCFSSSSVSWVGMASAEWGTENCGDCVREGVTDVWGIGIRRR